MTVTFITHGDRTTADDIDAWEVLPGGVLALSDGDEVTLWPMQNFIMVQVNE